MNRSMISVAYESLKRKKVPITFVKLWSEVATTLEFSEEQKENNVCQFYMDLSLDDRFVNVDKGKWDLKSRHFFSEVVVNTEELIIDDSVEEESYEDIEESTDKKEEY